MFFELRRNRRAFGQLSVAAFGRDISVSASVFPCHPIALLSLWVIANAETLIGQEFSQLVYIFEFLSETHWSNPYVGELSEFSFERNFPRVTEERYMWSFDFGFWILDCPHG